MIVSGLFSRCVRAVLVSAGVLGVACGVPEFSGFGDDSEQDGGAGSGGDAGAGGTGGLAGGAGAGGAPSDGGDAGPDADAGAAGDAGAPGCTTSADCQAPTPVCNPTNGECVECLPSDDPCPSGTYCAGTTCVVGCTDDGDCVPAPVSLDGGAEDGGIGEQDGGSDGGPVADSAPPPLDGGTLTCDTTKNLCVGCVDDSQCPIGTICDLANATCIPGCLTTGGCPGGFECCAKQCANTQTDVDHCGACDAACAPLNAAGKCDAGQCTVGSCDPGFGDCNGSAGDGCESQLGSDPSNCNVCGNACPQPQNALATCTNGVCGMGSCEAGFADCDGSAASGCEINTNASVANCGACGVVCDLLNANEVCQSGACGIGSCAAGYGNCDNTASTGCEANTQTDGQNCGTCGTACQYPNAATVCESGSCKVASCIAPFQDCDLVAANGCESNKTSDIANCGSCSNFCALFKATASCDNGNCAIASCNSGYADCDGLDSTGCEINTQTSVGNCGACNNVCGSNNATPSCNLGACSLLCNNGFANCDGVTSNGCEINTTNNVAHCGACNNQCPSPGGATPNCVNSACGISSCTPPLADCNGSPADGCEINTSNNTNHCGACGNVCFVANGTASCSSGSCAVAACNPGFANCDGLYSNGCETNLNTDPLNCNACGSVCNGTNGSPSCNNGACAITCNGGFANCDGQAGNGCETSTTTTANCGGCGVTCSNLHGGTACVSNQCVPSCSGGWGNCDGNPNDGCETSLTSLADCGACGVACALANAGESCATGTCQITTCNSGFGNCDGSQSNGCETNLGTSTSNCGACGTVCSSANGTPSCGAGSCSIVCNANFGNCDGNAQSNGCEANLLTNGSHCGFCGNACAGNETCVSGTCQVASCQPNLQDCDGQSGNGCECTGTGCCSGACQNQHNAGPGPYYYDCVPLGTYNSVQAYKACEAYGGVGNCSGYNCSGGPVVCSNNAADCICWGYTDAIAGHWYNHTNKNCWCPIANDPSWD